MNVVVAAVPDVTSAASLALRTEGVVHDTVVCGGERGYYELVSRLWCKGDGLVMYEHDVVPWPGATGLLVSCPEDWCVHEYPYGEPPEMIWALGAWKASEALTSANPGIVTDMRWDGLDHFARGVLFDLLGAPHIHEPGFAHVRGV